MGRKIISVMLVLCLVGVSAISFPLQAQVQEIPYNQGAAAAWQALLKLRTTATVLFTQAHPDDEDAGLVTWVSRHEGARTGILSLNRGEGGANLIGSEQYDALGILRTEEFLAACRYYGADLMFTRMADFGFSKRLDETLEHWGKENVLRDVVRAVRMYRPDIIISRFHGKARDGHGNHQAAGLLSFEVFKAAADPKMFPEEGAAWQVKKMYLITRGNEPFTLKINTGEYDPLLGKSYRQIASEGYGMHRSQAMGQLRIPAGDFFSKIQLVESAIPKVENEKSIFDGIDTTLNGLARLTEGKPDITKQLTEISSSIEAASKNFNAREPWSIAGDLVAGKRSLSKTIEKVRSAKFAADKKDQLLILLTRKGQEFDEAMNKALGLTMEVLAAPEGSETGPMGFMRPRETFAVATPGQQFSATIRVFNRSNQPITFDATSLTLDLSTSLGILGPNAKLKTSNLGIVASPEVVADLQASEIKDQPLAPRTAITRQFKIKIADVPLFSRPHWTRDSELRDHHYKVANPSATSWPFTFPNVLGLLIYKVDDVGFVLTQPLQTSFVKAPFGEQRRLLTIAPAINIQMTPRVGIVALNAAKSEATVNVSVSSNAKSKADGKVKLRVPAGWNVTPAEQPFSFAHEGEKSNFTFTVAIPKLAANQDYKIQAVAEYKGKEYTEGYEVIAHRDLEPRHLYRNATMDIRGVNVQVAPNLHVGYVMGVGDKVPEALAQIGVKVTMLGANELATGNLDQFDAVVIGIRASAVREDLKAYNKRLLEYVERGGNVVWQYQTPEFDQVAYGPYPYKMGRNPEEVSEEDARVTILDATNPIFNFPNIITPADFDGWIEERGSKWWGEWDARYIPLLESHDREQPQQKGGMMYAEYGKGTWVYAGYAFYRQLPAGVEGAYRLFANLISLRKRTR
jgi:LmbE family N-acetylglucosaminyl deacetylase